MNLIVNSLWQLDNLKFSSGSFLLQWNIYLNLFLQMLLILAWNSSLRIRYIHLSRNSFIECRFRVNWVCKMKICIQIWEAIKWQLEKISCFRTHLTYSSFTWSMWCNKNRNPTITQLQGNAFLIKSLYLKKNVSKEMYVSKLWCK